MKRLKVALADSSGSHELKRDGKLAVMETAVAGNAGMAEDGAGDDRRVTANTAVAIPFAAGCADLEVLCSDDPESGLTDATTAPGVPSDSEGASTSREASAPLEPSNTSDDACSARSSSSGPSCISRRACCWSL